MSHIVIEQVPSTPHFNFLHGSFGTGTWRVPYFAATVSFEEAALHLHLPTEIPGGEQITWSIDALYQRNIDWQRVSRQIAPYLRATDVPQFFNAVTVALLPFNRNERKILDSFEESDAWDPPELIGGAYAQQLVVGPIRFGFWDKWNESQDPGFATGKMRWNTQEIFAVAIDGQHRLAAIKEIAEPIPSSDAAESRLAVLFLVFDERVGFAAPGKPPTVELLRKLFIDLNKHARTVHRARQILLDDRDPMAVSVRALLASTLASNVDDLGQNPPHLPLALVDWFTEQAKFDSGPYLTTVLGLDWIVSRVLDTAPISDFTSYGTVGKQLAKLESRLGIYLDSARGRLEELKSVELTPFAYTDSDLDEIRDAFARVWNEPLCMLFGQFGPYKQLIQQRIDGWTLSLDWQEWYRLRDAKKNDHFEGKPTTEYKQFVGTLATREHPIAERALDERLQVLENLKRDYGLAFNVVFQRALVLGALEYLKLSEYHIAQLNDEYGGVLEEPDFDVEIDETEEDEDYLGGGEASEAEGVTGAQAATDGGAQETLAGQFGIRMGEFVESMNSLLLVYPDYLKAEASIGPDEGEESHYLWAGSLRKAEGGIDFTLGASNRASDWIFLAAAMAKLHRSAATDIGFADLWIDLQGLTFTSSTFIKRMRMAVSRLTKGDASVAGRIMLARGKVPTSTNCRREAEMRLEVLWQKIVESADAAQP